MGGLTELTNGAGRKGRVGIKILPFAGGLVAAAALVCFPWLSWAAPSNTRAIIHIPTKSLTSMPLLFGKDKGFFTREGVDVDLVLMSPPTAIAALVAGELDFSTTVGVGISATMRDCRSSASCTFNST
jgi:ABC-type nitrate/sulfonate/bicarbonate transport system substrate-binding protein